MSVAEKQLTPPVGKRESVGDVSNFSIDPPGSRVQGSQSQNVSVLGMKTLNGGAVAPEENNPQYVECLERVRSLFIGQPIFRDLQCRKTAFFAVTDFLVPLHATLVQDMAFCIVEKLGGVEALAGTIDVLVSLADRTSGPLTHAVSQITGIPYTLANWYPKGSPGEIEIEHCAGFNGDGLVFLNGLRNSHSRAVLIMDVLKTGTTAGNLVEGLQRHGVAVSHSVFATEILEAKGRSNPALTGVPISTLVSIHMRGECTKEGLPPKPVSAILSSGKSTGPLTPSQRSTFTHGERRSPSTTPQAVSISPSQQLLSPQRQFTGTASTTAPHAPLVSTINPIPRQMPSIIRRIKRMDPVEVRAKLDRVSATFLHIPIHHNPSLSYPYSFFTLTDFVPLMTPQLVEDMADLCVYYGDFERCDLVVSEADRGGGPLAQAVSLRVDRPFVLANWYQSGEGLGAASKVQVGFSGQGSIVVNGVKPGDRCIFVDDMLSSGGTAEGVLRSIQSLGGIPVEGVFISEKLYPAPKDAPRGALPIRKGKKRLKAIWEHLDVTTVVQFVADGERTSAPVNQVG